MRLEKQRESHFFAYHQTKKKTLKADKIWLLHPAKDHPILHALLQVPRLPIRPWPASLPSLQTGQQLSHHQGPQLPRPGKAG